MCRWRANNSSVLDFPLSQFGLYFLRHLPQIPTVIPIEKQNRRPSGPARPAQIPSNDHTALPKPCCILHSWAVLSAMGEDDNPVAAWGDSPHSACHNRIATRKTLWRVSCWHHFTCSTFHVQRQGHSLPAQAVLCTVQGLVLLVPPQLDWINIRGTREKSDHVGNKAGGSAASRSLCLQS